MSGTKIVFDTCAVIKLLKDEYNPASLGIAIDEAEPYTSVIVRMELLAKPDMKSLEEQGFRAFLADLTVFPLNEQVEQTATAIRRATKIKLPDCIVAATAIVLNAVLLTDDTHLLNLNWPGYSATGIR